MPSDRMTLLPRVTAVQSHATSEHHSTSTEQSLVHVSTPLHRRWFRRVSYHAAPIRIGLTQPCIVVVKLIRHICTKLSSFAQRPCCRHAVRASSGIRGWACSSTATIPEKLLVPVPCLFVADSSMALTDDCRETFVNLPADLKISLPACGAASALLKHGCRFIRLPRTRPLRDVQTRIDRTQMRVAGRC